MLALYFISILVLASFLMIVFLGAPYVPTKKRDARSVFNLVNMQPTDMFVDLGCGDGRLLLEAAKRGIICTGYELNPFLAAVSWWRLRHYRGTARVIFGDFWLSELPKDTTVVFVFLATPFMKKLDKYLTRFVQERGKSLRLVSYCVPMPNHKAYRRVGPHLVYLIKP